MIIDTSQGNIETYGDIKEFKTSIDPKNLEFITTLLSSNLYSDPEQSFIREIVSNAWDSHVEAGTTDIPVIVKLGENGYRDFTVTIRDYGTGLSPERFKEVYCNIGSSTKRDSNEYIGGFGIGKYSSLACSNTVYITSYYEGKAYYYVMVKSGNSITTNLLMEKPTTEKNGVEVTIKKIENINPYITALDYIVFFPNVYIDSPFNKSASLNSAKIKRFTNFAAATVRTESKLLLGNVLYPCNSSLLNKEARDFLLAIKYTGIAIKFDVGEINITPNRENIIYTSDTIKKIEDRIKAAKEELDKIVDAKITQDYDDLQEYYEAISKIKYYEPVTESFDHTGDGYRVAPEDMKASSVTYKGNDLILFKDKIQSLLNLQLPNYKGVVFDDRIYNKKLPYGVYRKDKIGTDSIVMLNENTRLINSVRIYLRENWNRFAVVTYFTLDDFLLYIDDSLKGNMALPKVPEIDIILEGVYNSILKKANQVDLDSDETYLKVKEDLSSDNIKQVAAKEAILYVYHETQCFKQKYSFKRFTQAVDYIKKLKRGVILANMDADESTLHNIAKVRGFTLIKARKDIVSDLKSLNLKCIVDIDWVLKDDPAIKKSAAIKKYFPYGIRREILAGVFNNIPPHLKEAFQDVVVHYDKFIGGNGVYSSLAGKSTIESDPYTEHVCKLMKHYMSKQEEARALVDAENTEIGDILTTAVLVKTKAYRVSARAYKRMRNNKLLNVLCRK